MTKLYREEGDDALSPDELGELDSWLEAGSAGGQGFGCEGACHVVRLYARIAQVAG